ncbi:MAG: hypothetical protein OXC11_07205 [Rhodospirillales bacterium]|nr:hypothetical protein [Rhodospirillales bacterium]
MTFPIDLPEEINDETAAAMVDFLYALGDAVANRYYAQISRYYDDQRHYPIPLDDGRQLALFPEFDHPF